MNDVWKLKICHIRSVHETRMCAEYGADLIGLHAIERPLDDVRASVYRSVSLELAHDYPAVTPVLLSRVTTPSEWIDLIERTGVRGIQIHTDVTASALWRISEGVRSRFGHDFVVIPVLSAKQDQFERSSNLSQQLERLPPFATYVLIDSDWQGGTGQRAPAANVHRLLETVDRSRVLIAGGVSAASASATINEFKAAGVDVQSSLRVDWGEKHMKDPAKIASLASAVKGRDVMHLTPAYARRCVALALTNVDVPDMAGALQALNGTDIDVIHLDHSDGSLAPGFVREGFQKVRLLRTVSPCTPYDIHLFVEGASSALSATNQYKRLNPLLRNVYLHLSDLSRESIQRLRRQVAQLTREGIKIAVALHAPGVQLSKVSSFIQELDSLGIESLNVVTHSKSGGAERIRRYDLEILKEIRRRELPGSKLFLGVDRDIDLERLQVVSEAGVNMAIIGNYLKGDRLNQLRVSGIRELLE